MTKVVLSRPIISPLTNALGGQIKGRKGIGKHLQPGVVAYDNEDGTRTTYLLPLEAIKKMRPSAAGKPVVGKTGQFDHVKVQNGKKYDGVALDSFWDGESGWEAFNFDQMNDETAKACEKGYEVSCAYIPTEVDETPGLWHNVPYDAVILNGEYTHFAVVPNPRYEGATIQLLNSLKEFSPMNKMLKAAMSLFPIKDVKEVINSMEEDEKKKADEAKAEERKNNLEKMKAERRASAQGAYDMAMKNASSDDDRAKAKELLEKSNADIEAMKEESADTAAPAGAAADGAPASPKTDLPPQPLGGGDVQPEPGVPTSQVAASAAAPTPAPATTETPEQAQEREKKALEAKNAADAESKAKADKEAEEKKNADEAAKKAADEKAKKDEEEKTNALEKAKAEGKAQALREERFNTLKLAAEERGGSSGTVFVGVQSTSEKEDLGRARYGSGQ